MEKVRIINFHACLTTMSHHNISTTLIPASPSHPTILTKQRHISLAPSQQLRQTYTRTINQFLQTNTLRINGRTRIPRNLPQCTHLQRIKLSIRCPRCGIQRSHQSHHRKAASSPDQTRLTEPYTVSVLEAAHSTRPHQINT